MRRSRVRISSGPQRRSKIQEIRFMNKTWIDLETECFIPRNRFHTLTIYRIERKILENNHPSLGESCSRFWRLNWVVKNILRDLNKANGGCLGGWSRWRTQKVAKFAGELPTNVDPAVSEWGNSPNWRIGNPFWRKSKRKGIRGSETSQYPRE